MSLKALLESAATAKIPLWQVLLLGGTTLLARRLLLARAIHTTTVAPGASKKKAREAEPAVTEDTKLVLIIRTDLGMTKGKIAAQCSHATLGCYKRALKQAPAMLRAWEYCGQAKVTLKCSSEEEMLALQKKAHEMGLVAQSICDAGRTQIAAGSRTVLGIGPGPVSLVDSVSGHLKLY
ncbi:hypothetical protein LPJ66_000605 [Kickxella alabastrina]|uniref:Uncharacterized protein n=1 Tax=Kickxella alabastrina TaxID=61397 RepID=A0ACC1IVM8_9FUNG|nr:hypothetical protein LPJ66_000605 [Kickxella alabastrina]